MILAVVVIIVGVVENVYWHSVHNMRRWLDDFAYRIDLGLVPFLASAALALLTAWLTVGAVSTRAAGTRPVKVLRYE